MIVVFVMAVTQIRIVQAYVMAQQLLIIAVHVTQIVQMTVFKIVLVYRVEQMKKLIGTLMVIMMG